MKLFEWLWRPQCAACTAPCGDVPLCAACGQSLELAREPAPPGGLERVVAPWAFGGAIATAIRRFKFGGATHVARTIAPLWAAVVAAAVAERDGAVGFPGPTHVRRRVVRSFDHTWLLAEHVCRVAAVGAPRAVLRRVRAAEPQRNLSAAERRWNLDGAFEVRDPRDVAGRSIVLLDDVVTTGATLRACATPLIEAGARRIIGVAIARTVLP